MVSQRTSKASAAGVPQYTIALSTPVTLGRALTSWPILLAATKATMDSEWLMMYSMAFSPRESYSGTHTVFRRLQACGVVLCGSSCRNWCGRPAAPAHAYPTCMAIIHSGQLEPRTPILDFGGAPIAARPEASLTTWAPTSSYVWYT